MNWIIIFIQPTESNSQQSNGGFAWGNILNMLLQMFLGGAGGGIDKADSGTSGAVQVYKHLLYCFFLFDLIYIGASHSIIS